MVNKVTLIGNVGQDPDIRTLENGTQVGRFSLATNESYKDKEGNWQTQTEWHNVVVWRELAERAAHHVKKGGLLYVEGKISYRKYTDKEGAERMSTDIIASSVRTLEKKERSEDTRIPNEPPQAQATAQRTSTPPPPPSTNGDDLPF